MIAGSVVAFMLLKSLIIYAVARVNRGSRAEALERTVLMAQGGEFAFVLYSAALAVGLLNAETAATLNAIIIVSMALTTVMVILHDRYSRAPQVSLEGMQAPDGLKGQVLIIGATSFCTWR